MDELLEALDFEHQTFLLAIRQFFLPALSHVLNETIPLRGLAFLRGL